MKESILDVLLYLFEHYFTEDADIVRDHDSLRSGPLFEDPEWLKYIEMNAEAGYLIKQESKLMSPAPFAPIKR